MVMDGRHFEHTLTVGDLEITDLNNITERFTNINDTDRQKQERAFDCKPQ